MRKRGEFEFLKHHCKCCGQEILLKKERIKFYEINGYPSYIHDHARKINAKKGGRRKITEFSYLPHYCKCCNGEIRLDRKAIRRYENYGYPKFISGHQMRGRKRPDSRERFKKNNPMFKPEIRKKVSISNSKPRPTMKGRKRPDSSILMKTKNPMWNPEYVQKCLFSRYGTKISKSEITPEITSIVSNIELGTKPTLPYEEQLKIALERVKINRENNLKEKKLESITPEAEEDNAYADKIKQLVGKFRDPEKKEKHYLKPLWVVKPKKVK